MTNLQDLLTPISENAPCGVDITYDPAFMEMDALLLGKSETQFSEAVKPDWKIAVNRCLELFAKSKNLQVATNLCLAVLQTEGISGLSQAFRLLSGLLQTYWDTLYPQLDPGDHLDPLERMNILSALCTPMGSYGDSFRFLERLHEVPLTNSPTLGRLSYSRIHSEALPEDSSKASLQPTEIEAAFRDTPADELAGTLDSIMSCIASVKEIQVFLQGIPGSEKSPDFEPLLSTLENLSADVAPHVGTSEAPGVPGSPALQADGSTGTPKPSTAPSGPMPAAIQSRNQVNHVLDLVCDYYKNNEPSSPVPLLIRRAQRMIHSSFLEIVSELVPDAENQVRSATGAKTTS